MNTNMSPKKEMTIEKAFPQDRLRKAIQNEYEAVARNPQQGFHFHTGRNLTRIVGYKDAWLQNIPEASIESFAGTGNPFSIRPIRPGENIVDIGSGAGIDSLIAAYKTGACGYVIGVDMTQAMIEKARVSACESGASNVEFRLGYAEQLPVDDGWADLIISNGVLNLIPDKPAALREMARVLRPDGRLQIADILVQKSVPLESKQKIELWTGCIAGALMEHELRMMVVNAGFVSLEIKKSINVFDGAPQSSSANYFGTVGINFFARKPETTSEWEDEIDSIALNYE